MWPKRLRKRASSRRGVGEKAEVDLVMRSKGNLIVHVVDRRALNRTWKITAMIPRCVYKEQPRGLPTRHILLISNRKKGADNMIYPTPPDGTKQSSC